MVIPTIEYIYTVITGSHDIQESISVTNDNYQNSYYRNSTVTMVMLAFSYLFKCCDYSISHCNDIKCATYLCYHGNNILNVVG